MSPSAGGLIRSGRCLSQGTQLLLDSGPIEIRVLPSHPPVPNGADIDSIADDLAPARCRDHLVLADEVVRTDVDALAVEAQVRPLLGAVRQASRLGRRSAMTPERARCLASTAPEHPNDKPPSQGRQPE